MLVKSAAIEAIKNYGVGSGASHLVSGHHMLHEQLAEHLARFTQRDKVLLFSSGYMANMAVISSLVGRSDIVLQDKLNHASLIDGGLLSQAKFQRYLHNDVSSLDAYLGRFSANADINARKLVVTDGIFSMDGDMAPLRDIAQTCAEHEALLVVDDAHGLGVMGEHGTGSVSECGLGQKEVPLLMGTFGKAFGSSGAFLAGSEELISYVMQTARPYIYTTALPPAIAAASLASLKYIENAAKERNHLKSLIALFRQGASELGFNMLPSESPIQPVLLGESSAALSLSAYLGTKGILVTAIRPPTVPQNTARLRVTFSATHTVEHIAQLIDALRCAKDEGVVEL